MGQEFNLAGAGEDESLIGQKVGEFFASCPDAMKDYIVSGLPLEFSVDQRPDGIKITATTRYRFSVMNYGSGAGSKRIVVYAER